jgi:hypothetical protein
MTTKSTSILEPTLSDAFEIGKREGLREAFTEIQSMLKGSDVYDKSMKVYVDARLKSILDLSSNNPFKQKEDRNAVRGSD